ncbi:hypothetical protein A9X73_11045 [Brachyspira hyodysenteriae]|nr:hypothetical protein A9X73_11045 [Brachyspira hyodysenteriae]
MYIPKQIIFLKFKIFAGLCPYEVHRVQHPTSFVATGEARLRREAKRLYFSLNLIFYLTSKTKLILFSTNFILALSRSVSEFIEDIRFFDEVSRAYAAEKEQQKIDKFKNLQYILFLV